MKQNNLKTEVDAIFWFRRDLRTEDNVGLFHALDSHTSVLPIFIFDTNELNAIKNKEDARITFIYNQVLELKRVFQEQGSDLYIAYGRPEEVFGTLVETYNPGKVYANKEYEPETIVRDKKIQTQLSLSDVEFKTYKDHLIFEPGEVVKDNGEYYSVYTAYCNKWISQFNSAEDTKKFPSEKRLDNLVKNVEFSFPYLESMGFKRSLTPIPLIKKRDFIKQIINKYEQTREYPGLPDGTSRLGVHFRYGTVSIRDMVKLAADHNSSVWGKELIWREFFAQLLWYYPESANKSCNTTYEYMQWRTGVDADSDFEAWCRGETGYPLVDAGMRELRETGYMHNRIRMLVASFLVKHLLIDWRRGEQYFKEKLLDYEMASNVGNWQWVSGSGVSAMPYFRIFNPHLQQKKYDPDNVYIKKWVPEYDTEGYVSELVSHEEGRSRALEAYRFMNEEAEKTQA